jgi:hypothetical protein
MDDSRMNNPLPPGAFLSIHYDDRRRNFSTWRVYYEDGHVDIFDGKSWWQPPRLTGDEIAQVKQMLDTCGIFAASNVTGEGIYDTAPITWRWRIDGQQGELVNAAYPAQVHPAMDCVMNFLLELEDKAK